MTKKNWVFYGALFSAALFFVGASAARTVFSADDVDNLQKQIEQRKNKISDLQKQIDTIKNALQTKQLEKASLKNQLGIINGRLEKTKLDISATSQQIDETQLVLRQTQLKILQKEKIILDEQLQIGELVRSLDHFERQTLVSMFAGGKTLSDIFSIQAAAIDVDTELTHALVEVLHGKQELQTERKNLETSKSDLENTKNKLQTKHLLLADQSDAKAQLLLQTQQSEAKFQKLVSDLKKQYVATEGEIATFERQIRSKLKSKNIRIPTGSVALSWPVPSHTVTAYFHDPDYPFRHIFEHPGIDIRSSQGSPVRAAGTGIIARAKNAGMGYSYIILIHNNKISTVYGHLSRILVNEDEAVTTGDIIGYSGGTPGTPGAGPFVTGAHLHFEVRNEGIPVNPLDFLP